MEAEDSATGKNDNEQIRAEQLEIKYEVYEAINLQCENNIYILSINY